MIESLEKRLQFSMTEGAANQKLIREKKIESRRRQNAVFLGSPDGMTLNLSKYQSQQYTLENLGTNQPITKQNVHPARVSMHNIMRQSLKHLTIESEDEEDSGS
jgi:hypothetical protein